MTSKNSNNKSSHVAFNFAAICHDDFKRVGTKSYKFVYGRCSLNLFFLFHENNFSINVF